MGMFEQMIASLMQCIYRKSVPLTLIFVIQVLALKIYTIF